MGHSSHRGSRGIGSDFISEYPDTWAIILLTLSYRIHIEVETRWHHFGRRHFQKHFLVRKCMNFTQDFTEVCS